MPIFEPVGEAKITEAILSEFSQWFKDYIKSDCLIIGGGPSGLIAAFELAKNNVKTLIVEANNYLGGGFWIGGYLMNTLTFRSPSDTVLKELNIPHRQVCDGLFTASGPQACSKLIAAACDAGAKILNMTKFDDVVLREANRVAGAVVNWTAVSALPRAITCVDPVGLEAKVVIDASGHDAVVASSLAKRNLMETPGCSGMYVEKSEDLVLENTKQVYPGLIACGMSVATIFGLPRMGPTFGAMLLSGKKAAEIAKDLVSVKQEVAV